MFRRFLIAALAFIAWIVPAKAQFAGYVTPQSVQTQVFANQNAAIFSPNSSTSPTPSSCTPTVGVPCPIPNLGQDFHILTYTSTNAANVFQLRLEGSNNGTTFFPISDDATSTTSGAIYAQGYYPVIRANLVFFSGAGTISVFYAGTSTGSVPPTGVLNQSQTYRKILGYGIGASLTQYPITPPCANTSGVLYFQYLTNPGAGGIVGVTPGTDASATNANYSQAIVPSNTSSPQFFNLQPNPSTFINVSVNTSTVTNSTYAASYIFSCPPGIGVGGSAASPVAGLLQPTGYNAYYNSENTSLTNTAINFSIAAVTGQTIYLFSVNARCSAGTAQLTVKNGAVQIWSSAATEVGTTTFKFQWAPGLGSSIGNSMTIGLSTCGAGNTGTLDVQASQL